MSETAEKLARALDVLRALDPRNPKRPDDDAGSNWAVCRQCSRGAAKLTLIRHRKHCPYAQHNKAAR